MLADYMRIYIPVLLAASSSMNYVKLLKENNGLDKFAEIS